MNTCKYINISCVFVSGVYTVVILSMLYCNGIIGEGQGARAQGSKIYILCREVARAGGGRVSRGQKMAIDFSAFSAILSAADVIYATV